MAQPQNALDFAGHRQRPLYCDAPSLSLRIAAAHTKFAADLDELVRNIVGVELRCEPIDGMTLCPS